MSLDPFEKKLKEKLLLERDKGFENRFWTRFNEEFQEEDNQKPGLISSLRAQFLDQTRVSIAMIGAFMFALILLRVGLRTEVSEQEFMQAATGDHAVLIANLELFEEEFVDLSDEEWIYLLEGGEAAEEESEG